MKLTLQVDGALHPVTLTEEGVTIGRGDQATIKIQTNAVSRIHARVFLRNGQPHVMDMKSLNGTSLNGSVLNEPALLHPGDTILLGETAVVWVPEGSPAPAVGLNQDLAPRAVISKIALEDRAFDASGSILVPHASLEAMLAQASGQHPSGEAVTLFQRLASMAGTLLRAAGLAELLESVMGLVTAQIPCQRGFILLADAGGELVPELVWEEVPGTHTNPISRTIARTAMDNRVAILTTDARMDPRFSAGESIKIHSITSALCAPLIVEDQALGVIYLETSLNKGGFKREDEHLLSAMANFAAVGIQREREAKFRQRLERYHSPQVVDQILKSSQSKEAPALQAQRCQISVLFADISGFTRMSEGMEPLVLAGILNRTFEVMTDQIFSRGGTLDKYIGDAIMAFFGAPNPDPDHAKHAIEAAIAMQDCLATLNAARPAGYPELKMRIGINSGEAFAGDIGCEKRMDYTVMGSTVNLASRLESGVAKPGQIVLGPRTAELSGRADLRQLAGFALKGIEQEVRPFEVLWTPDAPTGVHGLR
ncbi:adenylate/guanylate cyclase domain-containing protein [Geothrix sp. PMB-07]|uniref:adenylate/guanylate cyclase domain-containing protein n=1 Tax=Geothrix sp. PMB-07 TaxID=3068640 RepID=UPI002741BE70|nr:adenylate/guanylate cyclase domain-containing protein [Geothrix sp. PMB-07]WLT32225.1 adenylate/guanylate cyclase domain-containing protein [Geothrix sp. PMB-07]